MFNNHTIPRECAAVTPHDTTANIFSFLYIGTGGTKTLRVTTQKGDVVDFGNVSSGDYIWCAVKLVHNTATTASNIVGFRFGRPT